MHHNGIFGSNPIKVVKRFSTGYKVVLGKHLEPVYRRMGFENGFVMLGAKPEPESETGKFFCHGMWEFSTGAERRSLACLGFRPGFFALFRGQRQKTLASARILPFTGVGRGLAIAPAFARI